MVSEEYKPIIFNLIDDADRAHFSDAKQSLLLTAIARSLMWIAEELHEVNERCNDG